jgi:hypothetical protein
MTADLMTALMNANRQYTNPPAGQPPRFSQFVGSILFTSELLAAQDALKTQEPPFNLVSGNLYKLVMRHEP